MMRVRRKHKRWHGKSCATYFSMGPRIGRIRSSWKIRGYILVRITKMSSCPIQNVDNATLHVKKKQVQWM